MQNTAITNQIHCVLCSSAHIIARVRISTTLPKKLRTAELLNKARSEHCISCVVLTLLPADRRRKDKWQCLWFQRVSSGRELS